jgi:methanogenic corrinoid protein MtbC1
MHHTNPSGVRDVNEEIVIERLFQALIAGDRSAARAVLAESESAGLAGEELAHRVFWPLIEAIARLYRADQLETLAHHYATRLLRSLVDSTQAKYVQRAPRGRSILMFCGTGDTDDLAGHLAADLLAADGYDVSFSGGGVAPADVEREIAQRRPDVLLMFSSAPSDAPNIRRLIDGMRKADDYPNMQIVVGGGVFNRAEGLAEEIGADLWASSPRELMEKLVGASDRRAAADQRTVGRNRRPARRVA